MLDKLKISFVIPCLNEEKTIKEVINKASNAGRNYIGKSFELIITDNGSTDRSVEIIKRTRKARLIKVPIRGYGAALHWGILKAKAEYIFYADADLSYSFSELKNFLPLLENKPDLILGSRIKGKIQKEAMPFLNRYVGTPILSFLIRVFYGIPTTDCNSGMRMIKRSFYKKLKMKNSGMEWASELIIRTALHNGIYKETPIIFLKDKREKSPHLLRWSDGWRHLKTIILLKPKIFVYIMGLFIFGIYLSYDNSFAFLSLFILLLMVTLLSFLALMFLSFAIEKKHNSISKILNNNFLVPLVGIFVVSVILITYFLSNEHLGTKVLLAAIVSITLIWVFMIETIKTHLVNRLPDFS